MVTLPVQFNTLNSDLRESTTNHFAWRHSQKLTDVLRNTSATNQHQHKQFRLPEKVEGGIVVPQLCLQWRQPSHDCLFQLMGSRSKCPHLFHIEILPANRDSSFSCLKYAPGVHAYQVTPQEIAAKTQNLDAPSLHICSSAIEPSEITL